MALKNKSARLGLFVQNVTNGVGVTGLVPSSFTTIKLLQDNVLSSDVKSSISSSWLLAGMGNYSFTASASRMNYGMIQAIRSPSSTAYQSYSPIIYTLGGYLDTNIGSRSIFNSVTDKVSASSSTATSILDKLNYSLSGTKKILDNLNDFSFTGTTVDGMTLSYISELVAAMVNGNFDISNNNITFYKRNGTTVLTEIQKSTTSRTRIS